MMARVLIVAGSDSGGGAGIQADIKTVTALGGYATTAITALTAQDTHGVHGVFAVDPLFIARQMEVVLDDIGADAVKTGMLHSGAVIEAVVGALARLPPTVPLVVDPVMVAKGGGRLLDPLAVGAMRLALLPRATLLTPNLPEAEALLERRISTVDDMRNAARALLALGPAAVLLKGGHLPGTRIADVLVDAEREVVFDGERIEGRNTHGTGCTLASAVATGLAQQLSLEAAVERARRYLREAMERAPGIGSGHGPLQHGHTVRPFD
jgi:hydroxymethylpyrimidine/phosphomethylpyrimidine kinase